MANSLGLPRALWSSATLRWWWRDYYANKNEKLVPHKLFGRTMPVPDVAKEAWTLFEVMLQTYNYPRLPGSFWTYVVRNVGGSSLPSLHSYAIAGDKDPGQNPFIVDADWTLSLFSPRLVKALLAIKTMNGKHIFQWGGQWVSKQDLMHWYLACKPSDLATGIDYTTVIVGLTAEEMEFVRDLKRAVDDLGSDAYGAMKYSILNIREHRAGGSLEPKPGPKGDKGDPGEAPDLTGYVLTKVVE